MGGSHWARLATSSPATPLDAWSRGLDHVTDPTRRRCASGPPQPREAHAGGARVDGGVASERVEVWSRRSRPLSSLHIADPDTRGRATCPGSRARSAAGATAARRRHPTGSRAPTRRCMRYASGQEAAVLRRVRDPCPASAKKIVKARRRAWRHGRAPGHLGRSLERPRRRADGDVTLASEPDASRARSCALGPQTGLRRALRAPAQASGDWRGGGKLRRRRRPDGIDELPSATSPRATIGNVFTPAGEGGNGALTGFSRGVRRAPGSRPTHSMGGKGIDGRRRHRRYARSRTGRGSRSAGLRAATTLAAARSRIGTRGSAWTTSSGTQSRTRRRSGLRAYAETRPAGMPMWVARPRTASRTWSGAPN